MLCVLCSWSIEFEAYQLHLILSHNLLSPLFVNISQALNGDMCEVSSLQQGKYGEVQIWEVEGDTRSPNPAPDNCLDLGSKGLMDDYPFAPVTLSCTDSTGDGLLDFDIGIVWSVKKGDYECDIDDPEKRPVASSSPKCWYDENTRVTIPSKSRTTIMYMIFRI